MMDAGCKKRRLRPVGIALAVLAGLSISGQSSFGVTGWQDARADPAPDQPQVRGSQDQPEPATPSDVEVPLDEDRPANGRRGGWPRELDPGSPGHGTRSLDNESETQRRRGRGMGRRFGDEGRQPRGWWHRLSDEERQRLMEFIEEHFPMLYLDIERALEEGPGVGRGRLRRIIPEMLRLMDLMETDPQRGTLMIQERGIDMEIRQVLRQYRATTEEERLAGLRAQLRELCAQAFDARHERQALEIQELESRLDALKQRHVRSDERRDELIDQAVNDHLDRTMDKERRRPHRE